MKTDDSAALLLGAAGERLISRGTGAVLGLVSGETSRVLACGSSGTRRALDESSVFEMGSMTKPLTGLLLALMCQRGQARLNERVPLVPAATLWDLASHQ